MRFAARIWPLVFTLLLAVQGEPVSAGGRLRMIFRPVGMEGLSAGIERAEGLCLPVRLSRDGIAVSIHDGRLADGTRVESLTADELAARGVDRLDLLLTAGRKGAIRSLFLELRLPVEESLDEEERAERALILQRAEGISAVDTICYAGGGRTPAWNLPVERESESFPAAETASGTERDYAVRLAAEALRVAREAGFREGEVWLISGSDDVARRYAERSLKVPVCGVPVAAYVSLQDSVAEPADMGISAVAMEHLSGLFLHWSQVGDKREVKRLRRGGRRVVVWDVNTAEDLARLGSVGVDYVIVDDLSLIAPSR